MCEVNGIDSEPEWSGQRPIEVQHCMALCSITPCLLIPSLLVVLSPMDLFGTEAAVLAWNMFYAKALTGNKVCRSLKQMLVWQLPVALLPWFFLSQTMSYADRSCTVSLLMPISTDSTQYHRKLKDMTSLPNLSSTPKSAFFLKDSF